VGYILENLSLPTSTESTFADKALQDRQKLAHKLSIIRQAKMVLQGPLDKLVLKGCTSESAFKEFLIDFFQRRITADKDIGNRFTPTGKSKPARSMKSAFAPLDRHPSTAQETVSGTTAWRVGSNNNNLY
jgi:hypothetical protein